LCRELRRGAARRGALRARGVFFVRCPSSLPPRADLCACALPACSADASYTSAETGVKIRADMPVRLKVIGATVLQSALCAIGSIKDDFLGLLV